jgi:predicted RNase H-like HicB family nuclease
MAVPAPEEVLANAAEAIDRHLELRLKGRPHRRLR